MVWLEIPALVKLEVARCIALLPLAKLNFRSGVDSLVTASDASTTGGGLTASVGLSNLGQVAASCSVRGDVPEPHSVVQILTIGLFDGVGALRVAVDSLQMASVGHISVEKEAPVFPTLFLSAMSVRLIWPWLRPGLASFLKLAW